MAIPNEQDPVGNGFRYPIQISNGGIAFSGAPKGENMNDTYRRRVIRQSLSQIIATATSTWIMRRRFGSRMIEVPFMVLRDSPAFLERYVIEAITRQEKRVTGVRTDFKLIPEEGRIDISVSYTIIRIGSADTMTYPWYLNEAA
jgi:phage baseplate assembly protein W